MSKPSTHWHAHTQMNLQTGEAIGLLEETSRALMEDLSAFASSQMERNLETLKQFATVTSPQAALEIQAAYLRQTATELSAVCYRAGGLYLDTLRQWGGLFSKH